MATQVETILLSPLPASNRTSQSLQVPSDFLDDTRGNGNTASSSTNDLSGPVSGEIPTTNLRKIAIITHLSGVNFTCSAANGLMVISLPTITSSLSLPASLSFWPVSVFSLATASALLLSGSIADALGARAINLAGCLVIGAFMIGVGGCQTGSAVVGMRAVLGLGYALHLSSSVALATKVFRRGRSRNIAFSCLGLSQPLGYSFGLVIGGVLETTVGWRAGWFLFGGLTLLLSTIGMWALPPGTEKWTHEDIMRNMKMKVDTVGALLASSFMAMISYLLAIVSADPNKIRSVEAIVLLCLSAVTLPSFLFWVHRQSRRGRPALIPNSLWRNSSFSTICATIAISFAALNALELFSSLFFQQVQHLSALQASLRILPSIIVGIAAQFAMGLLVDRIQPIWIVLISSILCAGSPLLMALIQPSWPYWTSAFFAQLLQPISCDVIFTLGLIIITEVFPDDTQALAGAVFNTAAQFGTALGLAVVQVVSTLITKKQEQEGSSQVYALMAGYRASFWAMFAFMMVCGVVGVVGLRKTGRVGLKQE